MGASAIQKNPFEVTKAAHFTDQDILRYWVDFSGQGFHSILKPLSPMPMLIMGGKGSGKTHLMRYYSFSVRRMNFKEDLKTLLEADKYIGLYYLLSSDNPGRFSGGGADEITWRTVFGYHLELSLAQQLLMSLEDLIKAHRSPAATNTVFCDKVVQLFDFPPIKKLRSVKAIIEHLAVLQRKTSQAINQSSISGKLELKVEVTPGKLIFGIPAIMESTYSFFREKNVLYLLDEIEVLTESQQSYVHTLIRNARPRASLKIGSRLYGIKTTKTITGEENVEGSEFEVTYLDKRLRAMKKEYRVFSEKLCHSRLNLRESSQMRDFFQTIPQSRFGVELAAFATAGASRTPPHIKKIEDQLRQASRNRLVHLKTPRELPSVIKRMRVDGYPLLEKVNILLLYRAWSRHKDLLRASEEIQAACRAYMSKPGSASGYKSTIDHFRGDMEAQLLRDYRKKQQYLGFDTFVEMSDGLPRNLLNILKRIYSYSSFNEETPFGKGSLVSADSQNKGVKDASEWFYNDARILGPDDERVRKAIDRLTSLFREVRYADKPSECSVCSFSCDANQLSIETKRIIDTAVQHSLLIPLKEHRDKNSMRVQAKYQLNSMLSPRADLPISRRGVLSLSLAEVEALCIGDEHRFRLLIETRRSRLNVPFYQLESVLEPLGLFPINPSDD